MHSRCRGYARFGSSQRRCRRPGPLARRRAPPPTRPRRPALPVAADLRDQQDPRTRTACAPVYHAPGLRQAAQSPLDGHGARATTSRTPARPARRSTTRIDPLRVHPLRRLVGRRDAGLGHRLVWAARGTVLRMWMAQPRAPRGAALLALPRGSEWAGRWAASRATRRRRHVDGRLGPPLAARPVPCHGHGADQTPARVAPRLLRRRRSRRRHRRARARPLRRAGVRAQGDRAQPPRRARPDRPRRGVRRQRARCARGRAWSCSPPTASRPRCTATPRARAAA